MNPYIVLAVFAAVGFGGFRLGVDHEQARQGREDRHVREAVAAATSSAADAIATLRPKVTTIQNEVQREITTRTVYADCRHSPDGLRLLNQSLTGSDSAPAREGELPGADAAR
jgi:hypothetical protein